MRELAMSWRLLGFDARLAESNGANAPLPEGVRRELLLRPEILRPLSVDSHIWPAHYDASAYIAPSGEVDREAMARSSDFSSGLWPNLRKLLRRVREDGRMADIIGVELLVTADSSIGDYPSPLIYTDAIPQTLPADSELLGFDVADSGLYSGLCNCGYTPEERQQLTPIWADKINDAGLLRELDDAIGFRALSDLRVPEHAPFWVYRLHRLGHESQPRVERDG
jgi:hypothetical protein